MNLLILRKSNDLPIHIHDHPWGTEAALSSIQLGDSLLYGVVPCGTTAQALNRGDLPAISTVQGPCRKKGF